LIELAAPRQPARPMLPFAEFMRDGWAGEPVPAFMPEIGVRESADEGLRPGFVPLVLFRGAQFGRAAHRQRRLPTIYAIEINKIHANTATPPIQPGLPDVVLPRCWPADTRAVTIKTTANRYFAIRLGLAQSVDIFRFSEGGRTTMPDGGPIAKGGDRAEQVPGKTVATFVFFERPISSPFPDRLGGPAEGAGRDGAERHAFRNRCTFAR